MFGLNNFAQVIGCAQIFLLQVYWAFALPVLWIFQQLHFTREKNRERCTLADTQHPYVV